MSHLPAVPLDVPVASLVGQPIAVAGTGPDGRGTVAYVWLTRSRGAVRATISDTATRVEMPGIVAVRVKGDLTLREVLLAHTGIAAASAGLLAGIRWPIGSRPFMTTTGWLVALLAVSIVLFLRDWAAFTAALLVAIVYAVVRLLRGAASTAAGLPAVALDAERRDLLPSQVRPQIAPPEVDGGKVVSAADRVRLVRGSYDRLRDDIAYRIENSALFDAAVPATERLEVALLGWNPASPAADSLADEVERSFAEAREQAEALGFDHLPETARGTARRAHTLARRALGAGTPAERVAAGRKVADLLGSLALYYLPGVDPETPGLIAPRRQIEPRR